MGEQFDLLKPIYFQRTMLKASAEIIKLELGKSATISVILYTDDGSAFDTRIYVLEGKSYNDWGTSDDYIIEYVKMKLAEE